MAVVAQEMQSYVCEVRHELHAHPETRWETDWTRQFIVDQVKKMGFEPKKIQAGIVVDIGHIPGKERILCRADFDALPVPEKTGLSFASQIEGKSHACGHDVGTAMLLGFLKALPKVISPTSNLPSNLRVFFQDAEENPGTDPRPESGGKVAIREGVIHGIHESYALHVWSHPEDSKAGTFLSRPGAILGNSGRIYFKIECLGGHVAFPHAGVNALRVANEIMNRLSTFIARRFNPVEPVTLEPAVLNAGKGTNVMPDEAEMWWGFRTMLPRDKHIAMAETVIAEVKATAKSMKAEITDIRLIHGHPAMINNKDTYESMRDILTEAGEEVREIVPLLGGEDYAYIAMKVPSAMFLLDAYAEGSGGHHTPTFNPDEQYFWKGVHFWLLVATK